MGLDPELIHRLPEPCRPKGFAIADARVAAHGAVRAAGERGEAARAAVEAAEAELDRHREHAAANGWRLDPETEARHLATIAARKAELARLREQEKQAGGRFQQDAQIDDRLADYLRGLPAGVVLRHAAAPPPKGPADKVVAAERGALDRLQAERGQVELAPAPAAQLRAAMVAAVDALAATGRPDFDARIRGDNPIKIGVFDRGGDGLARLALWLLADDLKAKLAEMIGDRDAPGALTDAARAKRLGELDREILACERREEAAIVAAEAIGIPPCHRDAAGRERSDPCPAWRAAAAQGRRTGGDHR